MAIIDLGQLSSSDNKHFELSNLLEPRSCLESSASEADDLGEPEVVLERSDVAPDPVRSWVAVRRARSPITTSCVVARSSTDEATLLVSSLKSSTGW